MAVCSKHHKKLDENGEGKCSVPMWMNGVPAGFCDNTAYGKPTTHSEYSGYVPYLACYGHGGPKGRYHKGDPCIYCGTPHDDVKPGFCLRKEAT